MNWFQNYKDAQMERVRRDFEVFKSVYRKFGVSGKRICEFGAYPYLQTRLISDFISRKDCFSIADVRTPSCEFFGYFNHFFQCDFEKELVETDSAQDLIVCSEVFEHVSKPDLLALSIENNLALGGFLILTTPNLYKLENVWSLLLGRGLPFMTPNELSKESLLGYKGHVREYSKSEVCGFFNLGLVGFKRFTFRTKNKLLPYLFKKLLPIFREHQIIIMQKK